MYVISLWISALHMSPVTGYIVSMPIFRKYNQDFFKRWSTKMAYVLGFFAADGSMYQTRRGTHYIEFQITDRILLKEIQKLLGSDHKISLRRRKKNIHKDIYRLQIGSRIIFSDLAQLGMTQAKSKTLKLPDIPERYFSHFLRGYFDGDGNVTVGEYARKGSKNKKRIILSGFTCGSGDFLKALYGKIKIMSKVRGGTLYQHNRAYRLYFAIKDSAALYHFMYRDLKNGLFLSRKKRIFESYFKS